MECEEVGVILTGAFVALVLMVVTAGILLLLLLLFLFLAVFRTIGGRKPNRIASVVGDGGVFQELAVIALAFVIVIPSVTDFDCSQNYYDARGKCVSSLPEAALTRVKASAKEDAMARVIFMMVLEVWGDEVWGPRSECYRVGERSW